MKRFLLIAASLPILLFPSILAAQAAPDFRASRDEAVRNLQAMIRIDTSNPPGNETKLAEFLKTLLDREGIASEIVAVEPTRGNLIARIKGNGRKKPLLLMGHSDTVGVQKEQWTVDAFTGLLRDGYVYGRGALDDKGGIAAMLQVFLLLHRQKVPLDRDVIFLAEAGEEAGGGVGIDFLIEKHWPKIESEFALNEGAEILEKGGKVQYVGVATSEKLVRTMKLVARGTSGHGSMPRLDNAIVHLAAAVAKLGNYQPRLRLNETTRTFFSRLATISPPEEAFLYTHLEDPAVGNLVQETLRRTNVYYNSMLRSSISPNIIQGGFRFNVIPAEAEATLDVRLLPDENVEAFMSELRRVIDDPAVELSLAQSFWPGTPPSPLDSDMFRALEKAQATVFPGVVTLPVMLTGATDSASLRAKGVPSYGIGPVVTEEDGMRMHGNDERLSVEGLGRFVEFLYRAVVEVAGAR
jgi:acetylornithine deacetylase/succinyl-diaminopimelate desuccinylase-like protein